MDLGRPHLVSAVRVHLVNATENPQYPFIDFSARVGNSPHAASGDFLSHAGQLEECGLRGGTGLPEEQAIFDFQCPRPMHGR